MRRVKPAFTGTAGPAPLKKEASYFEVLDRAVGGGVRKRERETQARAGGEDGARAPTYVVMAMQATESM